MTSAAIAGAMIHLCVLAPPLSAQTVQIEGTWWQEPARPTRHTSFVATFDAATSFDADFARGMPGAGGGGMESDAAGMHGRAVRIAVPGGHLHYRAERNFDSDRGTVRLLVKGDVWNDETPRWLFEARGSWRIGIRREPGRLSLLFSVFEGVPTAIIAPPPICRLDLPIRSVSTDEWCSIVASWDRSAGKAWIARDGHGICGPMTWPDDRERMYVFYLGGGYEARRRGRNEPGLAIDEVVIYDQSLPALQTAPAPLPKEDEALLPRAETAARKCLDFIASLQRSGGWMRTYTWPTLLGSDANAREYVYPLGYIGAEIGGSADIGGQYLYASQVLADGHLLHVAQQTGELYLAVQDLWGSWREDYRATVGGIESLADESHIRLQDWTQRQPLFFLASLYRVTGDERCLQAIRRAGEFMLTAQNPNGSWSHHWDATTRLGRTEGGLPSGGEINDDCTSTAMESMVLLYHLTGETRYIEAVKRAAQWLIDAQLKGTMRGWADQYDKDNKPAWAREFEPPSCSSRATTIACTTLVEAYRLSHDDRYLAPVRECLAWMKKTYPDGKMYLFHDIETGRPICSWEFKIVFLDDPEQLAWFHKQARDLGYSTAYTIVPTVQRILENADKPNPQNRVVTRESAERLLAELRPRVENLLAAQNEAGVWVGDEFTTMDKYRQGARFTATVPMDILRYIEAARMAMGELPTEWRGDGDLRAMAYMKDNWYDVPW